MESLYQSADPDVPGRGGWCLSFRQGATIVPGIGLLRASVRAFSLVIARGTKHAYFSTKRGG
jgi:hypothetical protein